MDVPEKSLYGKAVGFIAARGITKGTGDGLYSPDAKLTRAQFLVMMMRAYGIEADTNTVDNFSDAGNTYYSKYLATAKKLGVCSGVGNNRFAPDREITRQEIFVLLYNTLELFNKQPKEFMDKNIEDFQDFAEIAPWAITAMQYFIKRGITNGNDSRLFPTVTVTRAEIAQVFYNLLSK